MSSDSDQLKPVDMVLYLVKSGRVRDFSIKTPQPRRGMLMVNSADGKVYRGSADGSTWEVHTTVNPERTILSKSPEDIKKILELLKKD